MELFFERLFFAVGSFFLLCYFLKSLYCVLYRLAYGFFGSSVILFIVNYSFTVSSFFLLGDFIESLNIILDKIELGLLGSSLIMFNLK